MTLVLIVDDEPDVLLLARVHLEASGYRTILAADAESALARLADQDRRIDVVVMDVMMPVNDGWIILEALRAMPSPPPTLVMSGRAGRSQLEQAERLGAAGYLATPFTPAELTRAVEASLAGKSA